MAASQLPTRRPALLLLAPFRNPAPGARDAGIASGNIGIGIGIGIGCKRAVLQSVANRLAQAPWRRQPAAAVQAAGAAPAVC